MSPVHDRATTTARWTRRFTPRPDCGIRLFCFAHAGGNVSAFRAWAPLLSPEIELVAIQPPGRGERFAEPAFDAMGPLTAALVEALAPLLDRPFAFFGHSMGAQVALATAQELNSRCLQSPCALVAAGSPGPALGVKPLSWELSDSELIASLIELGGAPTGLAATDELAQLMLPTIRADLTVLSSWPYQQDRQLSCPIIAFAGAEDAYASTDRMRAWSAETDGAFEIHEFAGGHFFLEHNLESVISTLETALPWPSARSEAKSRLS
jgi:medium-chain acyl-[acyl-carrier-protein] hydrolase